MAQDAKPRSARVGHPGGILVSLYWVFDKAGKILLQF